MKFVIGKFREFQGPNFAARFKNDPLFDPARQALARGTRGQEGRQEGPQSQHQFRQLSSGEALKRGLCPRGLLSKTPLSERRFLQLSNLKKRYPNL